MSHDDTSRPMTEKELIERLNARGAAAQNGKPKTDVKVEVKVGEPKPDWNIASAAGAQTAYYFAAGKAAEWIGTLPGKAGKAVWTGLTENSVAKAVGPYVKWWTPHGIVAGGVATPASDPLLDEYAKLLQEQKDLEPKVKARDAAAYNRTQEISQRLEKIGEELKQRGVNVRGGATKQFIECCGSTKPAEARAVAANGFARTLMKGFYLIAPTQLIYAANRDDKEIAGEGVYGAALLAGSGLALGTATLSVGASLGVIAGVAVGAGLVYNYVPGVKALSETIGGAIIESPLGQAIGKSTLGSALTNTVDMAYNNVMKPVWENIFGPTGRPPASVSPTAVTTTVTVDQANAAMARSNTPTVAFNAANVSAGNAYRMADVANAGAPMNTPAVTPVVMTPSVN